MCIKFYNFVKIILKIFLLKVILTYPHIIQSNKMKI